MSFAIVPTMIKTSPIPLIRINANPIVWLSSPRKPKLLSSEVGTCVFTACAVWAGIGVRVGVRGVCVIVGEGVGV